MRGLQHPNQKIHFSKIQCGTLYMSHLDTCIKNVIARICADCDEAKIDGEYSKGNVWYCSECWFVWDETQKNDNNNNTNTNTGNVTQNMNTNTGNVAPSALPPLNLQKFWL
eukprot:763299_1